MNNVLQLVTAHPRECAVITIFGIFMLLISIGIFVYSKTYFEKADISKDVAIKKYDESIKAKESAIKNLESASKLVEQYKRLRDDSARKFEDSKRYLSDAESKRSESISTLKEANEILKQSEKIREATISMIQNSSHYNMNDALSSSFMNFCNMLADSISNIEDGDKK